MSARTGRAFLAACALALAACAAPRGDYVPEPGLPGKDVIWLPAPPDVVEHMLDLARVTPEDTVVDLGSGDGRTVIAAARRGARAFGIEYNPDLVEVSRRNAAAAGVKADFYQGDIFRTDFSRATVVTLFLLSNLNLKLRPTLLDMKPGTRIVSNTFRMAEWLPDAQTSTGCGSFCTSYLWIVPAKVEGRWRLDEGELALIQDFQQLHGTLSSRGVTTTLLEGKLRGAQISFYVAGANYTGEVKDGVMEGTVNRAGEVSRWRATRVPLP